MIVSRALCLPKLMLAVPLCSSSFVPRRFRDRMDNRQHWTTLNQIEKDVLRGDFQRLVARRSRP